MEADAHKLYNLIWNQFVACQMTPAQYDSTTLSVKADEFTLKAKGRILKFDGWTRVQRPMGKNEDQLLPAVQLGDKLKLEKLDPKQHFTKPPARFTEAALVKELEKKKALVVHRLTHQLFQRFKIVVMFVLIAVASTLKKNG